MNPTNTTAARVDQAIGHHAGAAAVAAVRKRRAAAEKADSDVPFDLDGERRVAAAMERLEEWASATPHSEHPRNIRTRSGSGFVSLSTFIRSVKRSCVDIATHPTGDTARRWDGLADHVEEVESWVCLGWGGPETIQEKKRVF